MSAATGKIYERHVAEVTGGWQPENGRDRHDVFSGNGTRLEVKYGNLTAPLGTAQWKWDLSNKLTPGKYDRMILIGGDGNKPPVRLRYFDVPAEWILAWNQPNLA